MIITTNIVVFEGDTIEFCEIVVEDGLVKLFVEIEIVVSEDIFKEQEQSKLQMELQNGLIFQIQQQLHQL